MIDSQLTGSSSDKSCRSILAWMAFADSFLISAFNESDVGHDPTPYSVFCHVGEFADHLNPRLDIFIPFFGKLSHIVEAEAMHIAQLLIDND